MSIHINHQNNKFGRKFPKSRKSVVRVGIDLARIERFTFVQRRHSNAFYRRAYTSAEQLLFGKNPVLLALCFTAKEAVSKVLGTGLSLGKSENVDCLDIEIRLASASSTPEVFLRGMARARAKQLGLTEIMLFWYYNDRLACSIAGGVSSSLDVVELESGLRKSLSEIAVGLGKK